MSKKRGTKALYANARGSSGIVTPRKLWREAFENRQSRTPSWWWLPNKPALPPSWLIRSIAASFGQVLLVSAPIVLLGVLASLIPTNITENTMNGYAATAITLVSNTLSFTLAYLVTLVTMCSDKLAISWNVVRRNWKTSAKYLVASIVMALAASIFFRYTIVFGEPGRPVTTPHPFLFVILSNLFGYGFGLQCGWGAYVRMCAWGETAWSRRKYFTRQANGRLKRAIDTVPKLFGIAPNVLFTGPMWAFLALVVGSLFLDAAGGVESPVFVMVSYLFPPAILFFVVFSFIRIFDTVKPFGQRWNLSTWWEAFLVPEGSDAHDQNDWRGIEDENEAFTSKTKRSLSDVPSSRSFAS